VDKLLKLREKLLTQGMDGLLILRPQNRRYLSNFTGSSGALLITANKALLFTDFRYIEQATVQAKEFEILKHAAVIWDTLGEYCQELNTIGIEQDFVTVDQYKQLEARLESNQLVSAEKLMEELRSVKDSAELSEIERAVRLADMAFSHILTFIEPGMTEIQVALELEYFMRQNGASGSSFDFIVASGPRSSLPHGVATERVISQGEIVKMDFGCMVNGYCSDITRTIIMGDPNPKQREVYDTVLEAQLRAIAAIKPGLTGKQVDQVARDFITSKGYGDNFGHGLGHAVGLAIHEEPRLSPTGNKVLEPGMVVTVEPGVYLPNWGGVRIEDMVVVTETGCRVLTQAPKDLITL
jgi:Xaa-Pro aminopeptidase